MIQITLKFVHEGAIGDISISAPVMAGRRKGDKPLPDPMLTQT